MYDVVETSECFSDEAIVARVHAADSRESDDSDDVVEQPTQVLSSQEAQWMIVSLGLRFHEGRFAKLCGVPRCS